MFGALSFKRLYVNAMCVLVDPLGKWKFVPLILWFYAAMYFYEKKIKNTQASAAFATHNNILKN